MNSSRSTRTFLSTTEPSLSKRPRKYSKVPLLRGISAKFKANIPEEIDRKSRVTRRPPAIIDIHMITSIIRRNRIIGRKEEEERNGEGRTDRDREGQTERKRVAVMKMKNRREICGEPER